MSKIMNQLEHIVNSNAPKQIKIIRSLIAAKKTKYKEPKESFRVRPFKAKPHKEYKDPYLENSPSPGTGYHTIDKIINECHRDIKSLLNENKVLSYKCTADGLIITTPDITIQISCLANNGKMYIVRDKKNKVIVSQQCESPYPLIKKNHGN